MKTFLNYLTENKNNIISKFKKISDEQDYLNCKLGVQCATGISNITQLPKVKTAKVGDIYAWGISHYAVHTGDDEVHHIPEWGAKPITSKLSDIIGEYDKPTAIHRPPSGTWNAKL